MSEPELENARVLLLQAFDLLTRRAPTTYIRVELQIGQCTRMTLAQEPPSLVVGHEGRITTEPRR